MLMIAVNEGCYTGCSSVLMNIPWLMAKYNAQWPNGNCDAGKRISIHYSWVSTNYYLLTLATRLDVSYFAHW